MIDSENSELKILVVDDDELDHRLIIQQFKNAGYLVNSRRVDRAADMIAALRETAWDVVLADVRMPQFSAEAALKVFYECEGKCPFIVISGVVSEDVAAILLKEGASDVVAKQNLQRLVRSVGRELRDGEVRAAHLAAQAALAVSEERYALLVKGTNDGTWDWDLRTNTISFSPRWKAMLGAAPHEIGNKPSEWLARIHAEEKGLVLKALEQHLKGASSEFAVEYRIRHNDGGWRWVLTHGIAVASPEGVAYRMAGSQTDISAFKWLEEDLKSARAEAEQASRDSLAATLALHQPIQTLLSLHGSLSSCLAEHGPEAKIAADLGAALAALQQAMDSLSDGSRRNADTVTAGPDAVVPVNP